MAYVSENLQLLSGAFTKGNGPSIWTYTSDDAATAVDADGYISDGAAKGLQVNDLVIVIDTDASPPVMTSHRVASVTAGGAADLSDLGATLGSTDSD